MLAQNFEKKILNGLVLCNIPPESVSEISPLGLAVSGGADSVSLLVSVRSLFCPEKIRVITVDHGIRSDEESGGDAEFVRKLCDTLGVKCKVVKIAHGLIEKKSRDENRSVEDFAREERYKAFEAFISEENLLALCLAHNQNDQLETVLMRFLQGSGTEGLGGISRTRGKYVRPLLKISRQEIEKYLVEKNQVWRTDSTNYDTKYLRNRIRNVLSPFLNENFAGWQKSVLSGAEKSLYDEDFFRSEVQKIKVRQTKDGLFLSRNDFYSLHFALSRRLFLSCLNKIGFGSRFPFHLISEVLSWKNEKNREIFFENLKISLDSERLCIENQKKTRKIIESGFSYLIDDFEKLVEFDEFEVRLEKSQKVGETTLSLLPKNPNFKIVSFKVSLPVFIRSSVAGDEVKTADGKYKSVSEIFSDWKIPKSIREKIPVVEEIRGDCGIRAIIASFFGGNNWIVI